MMERIRSPKNDSAQATQEVLEQLLSIDSRLVHTGSNPNAALKIRPLQEAMNWTKKEDQKSTIAKLLTVRDELDSIRAETTTPATKKAKGRKKAKEIGCEDEECPIQTLRTELGDTTASVLSSGTIAMLLEKPSLAECLSTCIKWEAHLPDSVVDRFDDMLQDTLLSVYANIHSKCATLRALITENYKSKKSARQQSQMFPDLRSLSSSSIGSGPPPVKRPITTVALIRPQLGKNEKHVKDEITPSKTVRTLPPFPPSNDEKLDLTRIFSFNITSASLPREPRWRISRR